MVLNHLKNLIKGVELVRKPSYIINISGLHDRYTLHLAQGLAHGSYSIHTRYDKQLQCMFKLKKNHSKRYIAINPSQNSSCPAKGSWRTLVQAPPCGRGGLLALSFSGHGLWKDASTGPIYRENILSIPPFHSTVLTVSLQFSKSDSPTF